MEWNQVLAVLNDPYNDIQTKFNAECAYWSKATPGLVGPISAAAISPHLHNAIDKYVNINKPEVKMLDFGCGVGRICKALNPKCQYVGVDIAHQYLASARSELPHHSFIQIYSQELPFKSDVFDLVIAYSVLTHIQQDDQLLLIMNELKRVTKPNGILALSVFTDAAPGANWVIYNNEKWLTLLLEMNLAIQCITRVPETGSQVQHIFTLMK